MSTWAIVPVKPLYRSKSRLSGVLHPDERKALSRSMLEHSLKTLTGCQFIQGVLVVSRDPEVLTIARAYDAHTVQESGSPELNSALTRASQVVATTWNARRLLIMPSDLPLLSLEDLQAILNDSQYPREAVIAPDRHEDGTNALMLKPPALVAYSFGPGSFAAHVELATKAGAKVREYRSPSVALDVDLPEDLELYRATLAT